MAVDGPRPAGGGLDDAELMALVAEGDAGALDNVFSRYGRACYSLARRVIADARTAEDVVQDVFLSLWQKPSSYDASRGSLSTWLLSVTHHKAVDAVRREERLRRYRATETEIDLVDTAPGPDDDVWARIRRDHVRAALEQLPSEQREPLLLAYFGGYTQREIAGLLDIPLGTVKTRTLLGMRRLREALVEIAPSESAS